MNINREELYDHLLKRYLRAVDDIDKLGTARETYDSRCIERLEEIRIKLWDYKCKLKRDRDFIIDIIFEIEDLIDDMLTGFEPKKI